MAIKITSLGGTDWIDGSILYAQDLIDTIEASTITDFSGSTNGETIDFTTTKYYLPNGSTGSTTINGFQGVITRTCTLKNLYCSVDANTLGTNGVITVSIYKNGTNTSLSVSFNDTGNLTASNTSDTVSVVAGDKISIRISGNSTGGGSITNIRWGFISQG